MSSDRPAASIIIRNRNESQYLRDVLRALFLQDVKDIEVVVVDNESTDDSVEVARSFGAKIVTLAASSFTYGRALNIGLREATAEVCVILSAHSLPLGLGFIRECLKPFQDKRVAAARCVYVGKDADLTRWMEPEVLHGDVDYNSKGPMASGCVIRRRVWEEVSFDEEVEAAEDKLWAAEVLRRGYTIYSPCNAFYFYRKKLSPDGNIRKNYRELKQVYRSTGQRAGFVDRNALGTIVDLAKGVFITAPLSAYDTARYELQRAYLRLTFVRQARRSSSADVGESSRSQKSLRENDTQGDFS